MDNELHPITALEEGEGGIVYSLTGGEGFSNRLAGMGIIPGIKIRVLRNIGGLIIVLASHTRVALGKGEATKIFVLKSQTPVKDKKSSKTRKPLLVALAGQPNVGKSTVFNVLTGLSQHVGNWPGKTVEKKEGTHIKGDYEMTIVDLPGTYSLSAFSEEERVARDFIIHQRPDVIIMIANASTLERSLYLLSELLILGVPIVMGVNMLDVSESHGVQIDMDVLRKHLTIPVVPMVAAKNKGIKDLLSAVVELVEKRAVYSPKAPEVAENHRAIYERLVTILEEHVPPPHQDTWTAIKMMEGDPEVTEEMKGLMPIGAWNEVHELLIKHEDALHAVVSGRYDWIEEIARASISRFRRGQVLMTDRIDRILTRPIFGIPILLAILAIVFTITFFVGFPIQEMLESAIGSAGTYVESALSGAPYWLKGVIVNGVIGGAGSVLTFVPILVIFFVVMAFLENVGYMARAAFVMDNFMHVIGLHGKSFLPMCLGFGCNVPSVLGTRIIESLKARLLTIFLIPFVPCTARLATMTFITAAIFGKYALTVSWSLIALNLLTLGIAGILVGRTLLKDESVPFIMELPLYHKPNLKTIALSVWTRTFSFVKKAGTVILGFSIIIWIASNIPGGGIENSLLGRVGRFIEPLGSPLGLDWKMLTALISSVIAKENSIAALGVLYQAGEQGLQGILPSVISRPSALSFLVALMLFIPCVPTVVVMKQEMKNMKWFLTSFLFMFVVSYLGAMLAYRIGLFMGL